MSSAKPYRLTKPDYIVLEKVFAGESSPLPVRVNSKRARKLGDLGYLDEVDVMLEPTAQCPFPVRVTGWRLSNAGMLAFCEWASKQKIEE